MNVRRQHYVWRFYLTAWAENGNFSCLRNGKVFSPQPHDIAVKRDFYRLQVMTPEDIEYLEKVIIAPAAPHLKIQHIELLSNFKNIAQSKVFANSQKPNDVELCVQAEEAVNNAEERLHCLIEAAGEPFLRSLREGDASFFPNAENIKDFIHFLCVQYFRTKGLIDKLLAQERRGLYSFKRIQNVVRHIFALNVCDSIFKDRNIHHLILLENNTSIPFITSDQPIINIYSSCDGVPPDRLAFYYPVSPKRAMLLMDEPIGNNATHKLLLECEVEYYNEIMIRGSHEMLFSSEKEQLERIAYT